MKSPYSQATLRRIKSLAKRIPRTVRVSHLYPRAYCVAKPSTGCAVFVTPWMDAEPQVRTPQFSSSHLVRDGVEKIVSGDWCSLAYVVTSGVSGLRVIEKL